MLIVRRRAGESLLIGEGIELEVLEVCGHQVKLGIRASRDIAVLRREISITQRQNELAASAAPDALDRMLEILT